jgi:hypothetical protein
MLINLSDNEDIDPASLNIANVMISSVRMTRMKAIKIVSSLKLNLELVGPEVEIVLEFARFSLVLPVAVESEVPS